MKRLIVILFALFLLTSLVLFSVYILNDAPTWLQVAFFAPVGFVLLFTVLGLMGWVAGHAKQANMIFPDERGYLPTIKVSPVWVLLARIKWLNWLRPVIIDLNDTGPVYHAGDLEVLPEANPFVAMRYLTRPGVGTQHRDTAKQFQKALPQPVIEVLPPEVTSEENAPSILKQAREMAQNGGVA